MAPIIFTLFIFLIASIQNIGAFSPYPDTVVSLWRLDAKGREPESLLYVGALIKPNCIFILKKFLEVLLPLNTIGFYTGRSFRLSRKMENSAIVDVLNIPAHKMFSILVVKPVIYVEMTFEVTHNHYRPSQRVENDYGYFIGWNIEDGYAIKEVNFKRSKRLYLKQNPTEIPQDDFPPSSFVVKGTDIIAISYSISTIVKVYNFTQVSLDLTIPLKNLFEDTNKLQEKDADPFPEAVVSFWRLDENETPIELLYVGALIESNFILVSRDALHILTPFDSIGIYTRHKYTAKLPTSFKPVYHTIVEIKEVSKHSRFIILVMNPGVKLPNPYIVTNSDTSNTCSTLSYKGHFIGWKKTIFGQDEAEKKKASLIAFQENLHLVFKDNSNSFENFPLGSFLVTENENIKAIFHSLNEDGEPTFLVLSDYDSISIRIFLQRENCIYG